MAYTASISVAELAARYEDADWAVVDCRFSLADTELGRRQYAAAHIPGALYAHIDEDLSGPVIAGRTGRHPLPDIDVLAQRFSAWGIDEGVQVVAYDDSGGAMAGRLWWLLRWLGHDAVAVLDGGWSAWQAEGRLVSATATPRSPRVFTPTPQPALVVSAEELLRDSGRLGPGAL